MRHRVGINYGLSHLSAMARFALVFSIVLTMLVSLAPVYCQDVATAVIEGRVFDRNEALIPKVTISVEDMESHAVNNVKTDDAGHYAIVVRTGWYLLTQQPVVGCPIPYQHSSFFVSAGERVNINFRPRFAYSISDSIEGGNWIERYEPARGLVCTTIHFIEQSKPGPFIKDLRVQYLEQHIRSGVIEYRFSVTASFDRLTVYADKVLFYPKKAKLLAEQDVLFEDGKTVRRPKKLEIDLNTGSVLLDGKS